LKKKLNLKAYLILYLICVADVSIVAQLHMTTYTRMSDMHRAGQILVQL